MSGALSVCPGSGALVSVLFPASSSPSLPCALAVARGAWRFSVGSTGRRDAYLAEYTADASQASLAVALLAYVGRWRGVQVFVGGRPVGRAWGAVENVERVLRCYTGALAAGPAARVAYCSGRVECGCGKCAFCRQNIYLPCRHVLRVYPVPVDPGNKAPAAYQFRARAVDAGCEWCPLFPR